MLLELAASLGADVPAQVVPGRWLAGGAGERLRALPEPGTPFGLLVLAATEGLSTASVFAEADRLGLVRGRAQLEERRHEIAAALAHGLPLPAARDLLHNDLQRAAVSLRPAIVEALGQARAAGAETVLVSGSGPTVLGLFTRGVGTEAGVERARLAAVGMRGREPEALSAEPVGADFARVEAIATS
jgi:4-diphosphocytidyl-2-C-methyl-D-erythritol kinase